MTKRKMIVPLLVLGVMTVLVAIYLLARTPDVRNHPLTTQEMMLLNPSLGETVTLFELRRGEYELHLYHYPFGEQVVKEQLNSISILDRTGMLAFYSNMNEEGNLNLAMRTEEWIMESFSVLEVEPDVEGNFGAMSWGPIADDVRWRLVGEQVLMRYQFDSDGEMTVISNGATIDFSADRIETFAEADHVVWVTITRMD